MGLFRWRPGDEVEPGWADNDAVDRIALYRSAGVCLGRTDRIGRRWRVHSALSVVDHGWTIRRKISERFGIARRRLRRTQSSVAGLRSHVLLRYALQWGERC